MVQRNFTFFKFFDQILYSSIPPIIPIIQDLSHFIYILKSVSGLFFQLWKVACFIFFKFHLETSFVSFPYLTNFVFTYTFSTFFNTIFEH